jgi:transposase
MQHYVGLDVSLKQTAVCVVDQTGKIKREAMVLSDPDVIAQFIAAHAPQLARVGLETGATSTWLWTELNQRGLPVICIDARHAKAALNMQITAVPTFIDLISVDYGYLKVRNGDSWYQRGG